MTDCFAHNISEQLFSDMIATQLECLASDEVRIPEVELTSF
jgi:hypothetical protein